MVINNFYDKELQALKTDEANIHFFCEKIKCLIPEKMDEAYDLINTVIHFCDENLLERSKAWMYYFLSWYYFYNSDYDDASRFFDEAKDTFENSDDIDGLFVLYNGVIRMNLEYGQFDLANDFALKAISMAQNSDDNSMLVSALLNKAILDAKTKYFESARDILNYIKTNHSDSLKDSYLNQTYSSLLAVLELYAGSPNTALKLLEKAGNMSFESNIASFNINKFKGLLFQHLGKNDASKHWYEKGIEEANLSSSWYDYCDLSIEYGKMLIKLGNIPLALDFIDKGISLSSKMRYFGLENNGHLALYKLYKSLDNYQESLSHLKKVNNNELEISKFKNYKYSKKLLTKEDSSFYLYKMLYDRTELVTSLGQKLVSNFETKEILGILYDGLKGLVKCDAFGLILHDLETDELSKYIQLKNKLVVLPKTRFDQDTSLSKYCIDFKKIVLIHSYSDDKGKYIQTGIKENIGSLSYGESMISIPLEIDGQIIGAFSLSSKEKYAFDNSDVSILKLLSNYIAIALRNGLQYKKMENIAVYDGLTGFYTKKEILKTGTEMQTEFIKKNKPLCVCMIDIDNLKAVNDQYGHLQGDKIISEISQIIRNSMTEQCIIGRYGGDEFLMICLGINGDKAKTFADKIISDVYTNLSENYGDRDIRTTLSIGIYEFSGNEASFSDGVNYADVALYQAKSNNKNGVNVFKK